MPGLFGIVRDDPGAPLAWPLEAMAGRSRLHTWYAEDRHVDDEGGVALGRLALGVLNAAPQPASNEDGTSLAVLAGEVFDADRHRRELEGAGHRFRSESHAEVLLHGLEARGPAFLRELGGSFAAAIWDVSNRRLTLVNDRFGIKPIYYARVPGEFHFASEIKALTADDRVGRRDDLKGVAQFFTFGQLLNEDTLLDGVRLLPAAGYLTYDARDGRLNLDRYWSFDVPAPDPSITTQDHVGRIAAAFEAAVARCVSGPGRLGLSLSGGLDARTVLALIDPKATPVTTLSLGAAGSLDHVCAARMAEVVGCPHRSILLDAAFLGRFEEHLDEMVRLTDGHYLDQCIVLPTLPVYRELGVDVLLRGHAGELLHMGKAYNFSLGRDALALRDDELEPWLLGRLRAFIADPAHGSPFAREISGEVETLARRSLRESLDAAAPTAPPVHRVWPLFLQQRTRRETGQSLAMFNSLVETRLPYLDPDLVAAILAAPPTLKLGDIIQAHILRKHRPAFLDVVNANTGARLGASRAARTLAKVRMKVLGKLGVPGHQPYERLGLWLRRELAPLVRRRLLDDRFLGRGLFDPDAVRGLVEDHLAARANHTYLVLAMLIFEAGRRQPVAAGA